jgi:hypothetical protein
MMAQFKFNLAHGLIVNCLVSGASTALARFLIDTGSGQSGVASAMLLKPC